MSVEIEPTELGFHRPFTSEVSQILKIRNPNLTPVAFKVKTTAPKQYAVRPNSGRVEPGKEVEVTVLLQAMKQEPPLDAKCRDKFLVQSVAVTADKEFTNIASIWQHVDDADRSAVQEKKIRVVYLAADSSAATSSVATTTPLKNGVNISNGAQATPDIPPPAYSNRSPSPEETFTPQARTSIAPSSKNEDEPKSVAASTIETVTAATASIPKVSPMSYNELKTELEKAQAKIVSLTQDGGLKLRKVVAGETPSPAVNEVVKNIHEQQGVPLQIVAALCLLCFLIAYFFF